VVVLARYFLERSALEVGRVGLSLAPEVEQKLRDYQWPGNVRELENLIERLAVLSDRELISVQELPEYIHQTAARPLDAAAHAELPVDGIDFNALVDQYETQLITLALERTSGNKKAAAKLLRLNRTTLVEKIKKKGLAAQIETSIEPDADASI
jgi:DNA-binding NtrC family response regulator